MTTSIMHIDCIDHGRVKGVRPEGYYNAWDPKTKSMQMLHRLVYCKANGVELTALKGFVIRHTCDNPRCINPKHLLIGTQADNIRDMDTRGRRRNVEKRPWQQKLTEAQIKWVREFYKPRHPEFGQAAMARKLGVSQSLLSSYIRG